MKTVVFVDDERHILGALKRGLRRMRKEWKILFASGGEEALEVLGSHEVDALVSDMRMPGMSGDVLVRTWQDRNPHSLRIGLSGFSESGQLVSSSVAFHQFWAKPCSCEEIVTRLRICLERGDRLPLEYQHKLRALSNIPISSTVLSCLLAEISKSELDSEALTSLVTSDLGLFCALGKLLNTNFLGPPRDISCPSDLILSVDRTLKIFKSQEFVLSDKTVPQTRGLADIAAKVARANGADEVLQRKAKTVARLSDLVVPVKELLGVQDSPLVSDAISYLAALWGFPPDIVEALSFSSLSQSCLSNYLAAAREECTKEFADAV